MNELELEPNVMEQLNTKIKQDNYNQYVGVLDELSKLTEDLDVEIKERDFKKYFLPIFNGELKLTDANMDIFLNNMYILTNSYNLPISIIDENEEVIFRLPPIIMDVNQTSILSNVSFSKLINMYRENKSTVQGDAMLSSITKSLGQVIGVEEKSLNSYMEDISIMYKRYNISVASTDGETVTTTNKEKEEEIEYDYD